ncbi:hypothetical protein PLEI_3773 [Photobacterium leiognathi lrivu.4.1]|uniref:Uncharacterized protein n=1 Tax=Photobacterium leiognathi lrivu.4.1 TaxID=1248232 RepID=V5F3V8_PHOLE|nr:hypothetical protein PLEI_3773 [Photobacterium leiognathi lrivu.4.1]
MFGYFYFVKWRYSFAFVDFLLVRLTTSTIAEGKYKKNFY